MVNRDPFFEDTCDLWKQDYREEAEIEQILLKKQKSKLKLKKKIWLKWKNIDNI